MSNESEGSQRPVSQPSREGRPLTYYDVLDLDRDASPEEVKAAYYDLARKHHPDVTSNDPEKAQQFGVISQAYRVLSDPQRRHQYDRTLPQKSYPLRHPTPEKIWREATDVVLLRSDRFGPLNQAMQAAIPLTLDGEMLIMTMPGSERHLAGHMETAANRNSIVNALEFVSGQRLEFRIIDGTDIEDWERLKEGESKARQTAKQARENRSTAGTRTSGRAGEGPWDELVQRIHRQYQQLPKRQYPQAKARYLREALSWIATTDEELRYQENFDEDVHDRALARVIERLGAVLDFPAMLVALQLENMKRAGEL
jgi:curved DNA-binding protein CbpA